MTITALVAGKNADRGFLSGYGPRPRQSVGLGLCLGAAGIGSSGLSEQVERG